MSFGNHRPRVVVGKDEALATLASSLTSTRASATDRQSPHYLTSESLLDLAPSAFRLADSV
jgi:hypothetical protein